MDATGPTGPIEVTEPTGTTGPTGPIDVSGTPMIIAPIPEPLPDILTLDDILSAQELVVQKEANDKVILETIGTQSAVSLKPKLVEWVLKGKPAAFPIMDLSVTPPSRCSDGEVRDLTEYIRFCSGKSIHEHVDALQAKLVGITISFANIGGRITIVAMA